MSPRLRRNGERGEGPFGGDDDVIAIGSVTWRQRAKVRGRVRSIRVQPLAGVPTLELAVYDDSGGMAIVFLGRREIPGIRPGSTLIAEGMVSEHQGRLAILNPAYQLLPAAQH